MTLTTYADALDAYHRSELCQAQYDDGTVIMADVLVNLHGTDHRDRRRVENRLFRRETLAHYERVVIPPVLDRAVEKARAEGATELVAFGHDVMLEIATRMCGIDRHEGDAAELARLSAHQRTFIEALTLKQSTLDKGERLAAIKASLEEWVAEFFEPSARRRRALLDEGTDAPPLDLLTTLLRAQRELGLPDDVIVRECAFYLIVASHTTATAFVRAVDDLMKWREWHPDMPDDASFVQRCVHETVRLNSSSPVGMRRALSPVTLRSGLEIPEGATVLIDLHAVNRDRSVYGPDAEEFNPARTVPAGALPYGLTFGSGMHVCIGQDLAVGSVQRDDPETRLFGLVTVAARELLRSGARADPEQPPERDTTTVRRYWSRYPVLLT